MKPIREVSRVERIERALSVIEGLTLLKHDAIVPNAEFEQFSAELYRIAHCALGQCGSVDVKKTTGCSAWFEDIEVLEKTLKELGIMDVDQIAKEQNTLEKSRNKLAFILKEYDQKIVFAESCTAGLCSATLAQLDGISKYLCGSAVTYMPEVKQKWLQVNKETIDKHTCESQEIADEMAMNVLKNTPLADWGVSIVGIIGQANEWFVYVTVARRFPDSYQLLLKNYSKLKSANRIDRQRESVQIAYNAVTEQMMRSFI